MNAPLSFIRRSGCGWVAPPAEAFPFRCANTRDAGAGNTNAGNASARDDADPGSAGLAGLLDLRQAGVVGPDERAAVLSTGVRRG